MIQAHQSKERLGVQWVAPVGENKLAHFHQQGLPIRPDTPPSGRPALRGSLSDL